jgi:hypothetical protein
MEENTNPENTTGAKQPITWRSYEYLHFEKNAEWYWALGLITVSGAITALIFKDVLFAIFILIAGFVLAIFASRKPEEVEFSITQRGVKINEKLYPYKSLKSFGIDELTPKHTPQLILEQNHNLSPDIIIPLDKVDADKVHDFLSSFLPEEDHEEPLIHKIMEWLGF